MGLLLHIVHFIKNLNIDNQMTFIPCTLLHDILLRIFVHTNLKQT